MASKDQISAGRKPGPKPLQSSSPKTQYLILYNFVNAVLWLTVLGRVIMLVPLVGFGRVYPGVGKFLKWTQSLALLEVVHAATGLVRAPVGTTAMQVASRLLLVWGVVDTFPYLAKSAGYSSMLIAWSVTEVVRYSYFVFTLSGYSPGFISWLRYNLFYVLYPLGISSECWLIYKAIEPAKKIRMELGWLLQLILFVYVPGSYVLFTHMMAQRRKVMKGKRVQKAE
ncbi:related to protein tyrosine phosphatase-like protein (putative anti-phosphatase); pepino protein; pasticcino protein pas2 [Rhynchosporium agropyri]|uniref:Very-long-chain (3R)-3-hydroxyacyl-CoA dehydratase n=1 Tax=Rhynchosporium agropyri TaxID=914238 RepID=A0A1E1KD34_9HELO|nr:related to protein tyrosine phosphatase-like protein (putative anti-phosphatase); pepino protein; pasticcino protein pas2 [Rhynchosporium agropyri]